MRETLWHDPQSGLSVETRVDLAQRRLARGEPPVATSPDAAREPAISGLLAMAARSRIAEDERTARSTSGMSKGWARKRRLSGKAGAVAVVA